MRARASHHIPVEGPMLVEEAQIITERIGHDTCLARKVEKVTQRWSNEHCWGRG